MKHPNIHFNAHFECGNLSQAIFGCHETRIVEKSKALSFQNSFVPILTYGRKSLITTEKEYNCKYSVRKNF